MDATPSPSQKTGALREAGCEGLPHCWHKRPPSPAYLIAESSDDPAQVGKAAVDRLGLLQAITCGEALIQALTASQVHQAQHSCRKDEGEMRVGAPVSH